MQLRSLRRQAGDTIVEVMVVLAVLGLAISISYTTANRSLLNARQAQENAQATERLQSQIESLRTLAANNPTNPDGTPNTGYIFITIPFQQPFCVKPGNTDVGLTSTAAPQAYCHYDNLYDVSITYTANPANAPGVTGGTFNLIATWPDVAGQGNDTVTMTYRYYQL
jgi:prepilin-type N-terminal cleavage/methylation domain-containing protein